MGGLFSLINGKDKPVVNLGCLQVVNTIIELIHVVGMVVGLLV